MEFLKLLEGIRTSFADAFFLTATTLGEELIFILVGLLFFWCIDKKHGYYILSVGFMGIVVNQFLKLIFRIPRPWVRDPDFKAVGGAIEEATGYSFPSGHTQSAVGTFGAIARIYKKIWVRIVCFAVCVLVPFSRMYLGVHTPADVVVSMIVAAVFVFAIYPIIGKIFENKRNMRIFFLCLTLLSSGYFIFVHAYNFPADVDAENLAHGIENAYKMIGCLLGLWLSYEIDERYVKFETKAVWWVQIIKLLLGLIPLLVIKEGLKAPFEMLFSGSYLAHGLRYFLLTAFAGCVWPLTFKYFNKIPKTRE